VVDLLVAVDGLGHLVEPVVGCRDRRQRRGADHRRIQDGTEPPENAVVAEPSDALQCRLAADAETVADRLEGAFGDREATLVPVDEVRIDLV